jgi:hypothetical protein
MAEGSNKEAGATGKRDTNTDSSYFRNSGKPSLHRPIVSPGEKRTPPFRRTSERTPAEALQPDHDWLTGESNTFREETREETYSQPPTAFDAWGAPEASVPLRDEDFLSNEEYFEDQINFLSEKLDRCKRLQWLLLGALLIATAVNVLLLMR